MIRRLSAIAALLALTLAGCSGPDDAEGAVTSPTVSPTRSDPFATPASTPSPLAGTPFSSPAGRPGFTPGAPYDSFFTHDLLQGPRTVERYVLSGHGPTPVVIGFHPGLEPTRLRCGTTNVTVSLLDPTGLALATVRGADQPVGPAGCPSSVRVPDVGFTEGTWRLVFEGQGDIMAFVGSAARAREWNVSYESTLNHDFFFPSNTSLLDVPEYGSAVDVTIRFAPRAGGSTCQGDARVILRDPNDNVVDRIDLPPQASPQDCTKSRTLSDVVLRPGRWTVQWGGNAELIGTVFVEPTNA